MLLNKGYLKKIDIENFIVSFKYNEEPINFYILYLVRSIHEARKNVIEIIKKNLVDT